MHIFFCFPVWFCTQRPARATTRQERSSWTPETVEQAEETTPAAWRECWPASLWWAAPPTAAWRAATAPRALTRPSWTKDKVGTSSATVHRR